MENNDNYNDFAKEFLEKLVTGGTSEGQKSLMAALGFAFKYSREDLIEMLSQDGEVEELDFFVETYFYLSSLIQLGETFSNFIDKIQNTEDENEVSNLLTLFINNVFAMKAATTDNGDEALDSDQVA